MNAPAFHEVQAARDAERYSDNAQRSESADRFGFEQVAGGNAELTAETFGEFVSLIADERAPLLVKSTLLLGPISSSELLKIMFDRRNSDAQIAAATRELATRYLEDEDTKRVILSETIGAM